MVAENPPGLTLHVWREVDTVQPGAKYVVLEGELHQGDIAEALRSSLDSVNRDVFVVALVRKDAIVNGKR